MRLSKQQLLKMFPIGTTIQLVEMTDIHAPKPGTLGKITNIDDQNTIFVSWENGSNLGLIYLVDKFKIIKSSPK